MYTHNQNKINDFSKMLRTNTTEIKWENQKKWINSCTDWPTRIQFREYKQITRSVIGVLLKSL